MRCHKIRWCHHQLIKWINENDATREKDRLSWQFIGCSVLIKVLHSCMHACETNKILLWLIKLFLFFLHSLGASGASGALSFTLSHSLDFAHFSCKWIHMFCFYDARSEFLNLAARNQSISVTKQQFATEAVQIAYVLLSHRIYGFGNLYKIKRKLHEQIGMQPKRHHLLLCAPNESPSYCN